MKNFINNKENLAITKERKDVLEIAEAAYRAIDTEFVVRNNVRIEDDVLVIKDSRFNLKDYERIRLIGFGKASCLAIFQLEKILGPRVHDGIAIDKKVHTCETVQVFEGSHPRPSEKNVEASEKIVFLAKESTEKDLVIVVVSGGGSALLCFPASECDQGIKLYDVFLSSGGTISELNTVRKHISMLKGGGLAKILYPATVIGLIFSDVPGDHYNDVASGPTYKDSTTSEDAKEILKKYGIENQFELTETPKEDVFFERVYNIPLVSNTIALSAMEKKANELGYKSQSLGGELYDFAEDVVTKFYNTTEIDGVSVGGGEPRMVVTGKGGTGGRNQYTALTAMNKIKKGDVFLAFASDGIDNKSVYAGAMVDEESIRMAKEKGLEINKYLDSLDTEGFLSQTNSLVETGPTGSNVSDLMIYLRSHE